MLVSPFSEASWVPFTGSGDGGGSVILLFDGM